MLNKKSLVLSFVAFATLASCAMPTTTTKKASTDEALDVDRSIGATTVSKMSAISSEVKTLVDSINKLSGKADITSKLDAMLKKNITTTSCMTAPKPGPQGANVTGAPGQQGGRGQGGPQGANNGGQQQGGQQQGGPQGGQGQGGPQGGQGQGGPQGGQGQGGPVADPCKAQVDALITDLKALENSLKKPV